MSKPLTYELNFIAIDPFFETTVGKVLLWTVSIGRYIIIFTATVVIVSFASRFYLDRKLTDLNNEIHQKSAVIESQHQLENDFRFTQFRIQTYEQLEKQDNLTRIFPILQKIVPRNLILRKLEIKQDELIAESIALSNDALNFFISNMQLSEYFQDIAVERIESRDEKSVGFRVTVKAKYNIPEEES